jgi:hypothetical protein
LVGTVAVDDDPGADDTEVTEGDDELSAFQL